MRIPRGPAAVCASGPSIVATENVHILGKAEVSPRKPEDMLVYLLSACVETSLDRVSVWSRFALILVFCDEFGSHSRNGYATLFIFSEVILRAPALL